MLTTLPSRLIETMSLTMVYICVAHCLYIGGLEG